MNESRPKRPIAGLIIMAGIAMCFYAMSFISFPANHIIPDYMTWLKECTDGSVLAKIAYMFSDIADPAYQKTALGGILMIAGSAISLYTGKRSKCTFGVSYGSGLFWQIVAGQLLASGGSVFLYQYIFKVQKIDFVPTFIAVASITPAIILLYGGEWYKVLTAAVMGLLLGCPFAYYVNVHFTTPWGLPGCVAWVTPMVIGGLISEEVCRALPWMRRQDSDLEPEIKVEKKDKPVLGAVNASTMDSKWFIKRVFADFTEPTFYGNELGGMLFVLGGIISIFLNPKNPGYGDGNTYLVILASQILCSAVGVFVYWHKWYELGWYNTFVPIASLTPAFVLFYGTKLYVVIVGAIIGGVFMPPVAAYIGSKLTPRYHGYIGSVASMWICTVVFIGIFNYVPGFGC